VDSHGDIRPHSPRKVPSFSDSGPMLSAMPRVNDREVNVCQMTNARILTCSRGLWAILSAIVCISATGTVDAGQHRIQRSAVEVLVSKPESLSTSNG
jgi:hypothetical protein